MIAKIKKLYINLFSITKSNFKTSIQIDKNTKELVWAAIYHDTIRGRP
jgi:hypothetical protein